MTIANPSPGDRVHILPIQENGTVENCRRDSLGTPLIEVIRDSDGKTHLCRECELAPPNEVTLTHHNQSVRLSLHSQNNERTAILRVNGKDYPVAIDLENGKLKLSVWDVANVDGPFDTMTLEGYL